MIGFSNKTWKIFTWFGIPIFIDVMFIALVVLCMVSTGSLIGGIAFAALLGFSIIAHELGHSLTARKFGFRTRSITLSVLGGCAALEGIPRDPLQETLVAVAGPAVSLCLGLVGLAISSIVETSIATNFAVLNIVLAVFNLLPGFPMDGGRVLRALLSYILKNRSKATWWAVKVGKGVAIFLAAVGVLSILAGVPNGVMLALIAWFIWKAGEQEYAASFHRP